MNSLLVSDIIQVRRLTTKFKYSESNIISMGGCPVWFDIVSETTVDVAGRNLYYLKILE